MIATEEDEWMMDYTFCLSIEYLIQFSVCLFGSFCIHDTESIHHAVNMCIDSDIGHIIEDGEDYFCGFDTNTWECLDQFQIIWDFSLVLGCEYHPSFFYKSRLVSEKVHIPQMLLDILERNIYDIMSLFYYLKKWWRDPVHLFVCGLGREYHGTEELKMSLIIELYLVSTVLFYNRTQDVSPVFFHILFRCVPIYEDKIVLAYDLV